MMAKSVWISGRPIAIDDDFKQWTSGKPFIYLFPTAGEGYSIVIESGQYAFYGNPVSVLAQRKLLVDFSVYVLNGQDLNLLAARKLLANVSTYVLTGQDLNLLAARKLLADVSTYVLTGQDLNLLAARKLLADVSTYELTDQALNLLKAYNLKNAGGIYLLLGMNAGLDYSAYRIIPIGAKKTVEILDRLAQRMLGKSTLDAYRKKTEKGELKRWQS